jgi:hypothetical protein
LDVESRQTVDEAIDRVRGVANEAIGRMQAEILQPLLDELGKWRALAERLNLSPKEQK